MGLWLATVLLDALVVAGLALLVERTGRRQARAVADERRRLVRLHRAVEALIADVERRTRTLDEALAAREATLRVLLETAAVAPDRAAALLDVAAIRVLHDADLSLAHPAADGAAPATAG